MKKFYPFLLSVLLFMISCQKPNEAESFSIPYEKFVLDNGLEVILHVDKSDPIVAVATMMHVGSNREKPGKTGFAHFFEHMAFNDSENVPVGANRKMIPEWGGERNGGTWSDGTVYYEVVPKDAFEKILWIDSDRFGYMINTVTEAALEREKQVVKNEKRQRVDNSPYGYVDEIIRKNLYPEGHPYSWTVIGSLPDLQAANLEDVREFYDQYYGAANATLVIAGDIDIAETKALVEKWFGEIPRGPEVEKMAPMPVALKQSQSLYFEDNFAKLPELRIVFPTVEDYHKDMYALDMLSALLTGSKKSHLYKTIVEEAKLAPSVSAFNRSNELAGEFVFVVRANEGTALDEVKAQWQQGLQNFEENGFDDNELKRIKAEMETALYMSVATVLNKAFQLAQDNEFGSDPAFVTKRAKLMQEVSREDIMRVYNTYIKNQNYLMLSTVPRGQLDLAVSESNEATVWQEEVTAMSANEEVSQGEEAVYEKTPSKHDRSEPDFGEAPLFVMPKVWTSQLSNGMNVYGIEDNELPLVYFNIFISGGQQLDTPEKAGLTNLMARMLNEGTATKTAAELEEAIGLLGANIRVSSSMEEVVISGNCLSRNFDATLALVEEMLLHPRWDTSDFEKIKQQTLTAIKGSEANPTAIASKIFNKLMYGDKHIYSYPTTGTAETVASLTLEDLKAHYQSLNPQEANFHLVGQLPQARVMEALKPMENNWTGSAAVKNIFTLPQNQDQGTVYFIDVPDAKQSVIYVGNMAVAATDGDAVPLRYANEILGGGSSGKLFQTLRIEKGYTYGAYSYIPARLEKAPFTLTTSVRANATLPSLQIIETMLQNYGDQFSDDEVALTQNKIIKANTRAFESLNAKLAMLTNISKYNRTLNYVESDQDLLMQMQKADFKNMIANYMNENNMIYVVVGDKATQFNEVAKFGKPVVELDIYGNQL